MKQLSTIDIKEKKITIQTEVANHPQPQIRTLAYLGGKILIKREQTISPDLPEEKLQSLITIQHITVENEIKFKLSGITTKKAKSG